jgi:hypothetical protein
MIEAQTSLPTDVTADGGGHMTSILTVIAGAVTGLFAWIGKAWNRKEKQLTNVYKDHLGDLKEQRDELMTLVVTLNKEMQNVALDSKIAINNCTRAVETNTIATKEFTTQSKLNQYVLSRLSCVQDQQKPASGTDTLHGE